LEIDAIQWMYARHYREDNQQQNIDQNRGSQTKRLRGAQIEVGGVMVK